MIQLISRARKNFLEFNTDQTLSFATRTATSIPEDLAVIMEGVWWRFAHWRQNNHDFQIMYRGDSATMDYRIRIKGASTMGVWWNCPTLNHMSQLQIGLRKR